MIIRICGRWFCMKLILKIFIRCANVLILMLMCVESESMKWLFRTEMGCSKYLSVLFMQVSLNRGISIQQAGEAYSAVRCQVCFLPHRGIEKQ